MDSEEKAAMPVDSEVTETNVVVQTTTSSEADPSTKDHESNGDTTTENAASMEGPTSSSSANQPEASTDGPTSASTDDPASSTDQTIKSEDGLRRSSRSKRPRFEPDELQYYDPDDPSGILEEFMGGDDSEDEFKVFGHKADSDDSDAETSELKRELRELDEDLVKEARRKRRRSASPKKKQLNAESANEVLLEADHIAEGLPVVFSCPRCGQMFNSRDTVLQHVQTEHSDVIIKVPALPVIKQEEGNGNVFEEMREDTMKMETKSEAVSAEALEDFKGTNETELEFKESLDEAIGIDIVPNDDEEERQIEEEERQVEDDERPAEQDEGTKEQMTEDAPKMVSESPVTSQCNMCSALFRSSDEVSEHFKAVHAKPNEQEGKCAFCSYVYTILPLYKAHLRSDHPKVAVNLCEICHAVFKSHIFLTRHKNSVHGVRLTCVECKVTFSTAVKYDGHACVKKEEEKKDTVKPKVPRGRGKKKVKKIECADCGFMGRSPLELRHHRDYCCMAQKSKRCLVCRKSFTDLGEYRSHLLTQHQAFKVFPCEHCIYTYIYESDLQSHVQTDHAKVR